MAIDVRAQLPKRPGYGSAGKAVKVLANYFNVAPSGQFCNRAVHYDVDIRPLENQDKGEPDPVKGASSRICVLLL